MKRLEPDQVGHGNHWQCGVGSHVKWSGEDAADLQHARRIRRFVAFHGTSW